MQSKMDKSTGKKTRSFKCNVERDLFAYKGFSFFLYGAFGSFYPYLLLYFKQYGLSSFQAGSIVGIRPLIQLFGAPFWTAIGERFKAERIVLMCGVLAWLIKALILLFVTPHKQLCVENYTNSTNNITSVYTSDLWRPHESQNHEWTLVTSLGKPNLVPKNKLVQVENPVKPAKRSQMSRQQKRKEFVDKTMNNRHRDEIFRSKYPSSKLGSDRILFETMNYKRTISNVITVKHYVHSLNQTVSFITQVDDEEITYMFWIFLMIIVIAEFLESPTYALSDASLLNRLADDRSYYGRIRLWGAIGWAISTAIVGYLIFKTSFILCGLLKPNYDVIFYVYFGFVSCAFICSYWFSFKENEEHHKSSFRKALNELCCAKHCVFMIAIIFTGCCYGLLFHFVNWYIDDKGGSAIVMGAAGAARELGEMIFFFCGGVCVRILGNLNTMAICLVSYSACFYWYSVIESPWLAVLLEALDGSIYGLVWSNSIDYMSTIGAPIGAVVTMQGILQGLFYGLGNGGGTVLSGHLYDKLGPQKTFQIFAKASLVILFCLLLGYPFASTGFARQREHIGETEYKPVVTDSHEDEPAIGSSNESAKKEPALDESQ
ncbi:major facilitator superfamily domain-containing protein 6-like [Actinia tenebrosa]|uniref:Major facilitator superfamily domain-containing protein 6-like n=1 Tax=Actinia tenebrosa TaxID=6105 RepID=A0A6P8IJ83_ACTTE|nr:major facilitator superfamily domain-containing protein 6-like [Actinia tenebrosa]